MLYIFIYIYNFLTIWLVSFVFALLLKMNNKKKKRINQEPKGWNLKRNSVQTKIILPLSAFFCQIVVYFF